MGQELVSVIMPTYNTGKFLSASIESVLSQTYNNIELIITDDCSTDQITINTLNYYSKKDPRIKISFFEKNMGAGPARNKSIEEAKGRYIAFCDSDDRWLPNKLEKQIAFMEEKHCQLTYSSYFICDEDDNNTGIFIAPSIVTYHGMLRDDKIGFLTAIYDTKAVGEKIFFPNIKRRQDWAMLIKLLQKCQVAHGLKEPLGIYRKRKGSISYNKLALVKYNTKVYEEVLGYSRIKSYLFFTFVFMPTYFIKLMKKKIDSFLYYRKKQHLPLPHRTQDTQIKVFS